MNMNKHPATPRPNMFDANNGELLRKWSYGVLKSPSL